MQHTHLKTLTVATGLSLALCASPAWSEQECKNTITATTPSSDFTAHGNGTVTHHKTGLMWKVCSEGQTFKMSNGAPTCTGTPSTKNWKATLADAEAASFAGKSDWRLPNINELNSIVELSCNSPTINASVFPNTPSEKYWSSSILSSFGGNAWNLDFSLGINDNYRTQMNKTYRARLVRTQ